MGNWTQGEKRGRVSGVWVKCTLAVIGTGRRIESTFKAHRCRCPTSTLKMRRMITATTMQMLLFFCFAWYAMFLSMIARNCFAQSAAVPLSAPAPSWLPSSWPPAWSLRDLGLVSTCWSWPFACRPWPFASPSPFALCGRSEGAAESAPLNPGYDPGSSAGYPDPGGAAGYSDSGAASAGGGRRAGADGCSGRGGTSPLLSVKLSA
eukprot:1183207-Prorocentrum_minimum.AAC.2